ncbi:DUF2087 domain-containing protein [Halobaculum sp. MBLA0147]|uniref:DUF2087 domain-containing protein n=1 Tax=Halobaculum sp. MBLA0147 TaxID=3079934 RepID=UPI003524A413
MTHALTYDRDPAAVFADCRDRGRLPRNDALELIVLERLLDDADVTVGETYQKAALNDRLDDAFDDATVRRELVNLGYLQYDNTTNEYTVVKTRLSEAEIRDTTRLADHARDLGVLD